MAAEVASSSVRGARPNRPPGFTIELNSPSQISDIIGLAVG